MINKIIIVGHISIDKYFIFNKLLNINIESNILSKILSKNNKLPIHIKLGNYNINKIVYKNNSYNLDDNTITNKIDNIINSLFNNIYYDELIIEYINTNINLDIYILPSYEIEINDNDFIDNQYLSLYDKYITLDDVIIINLIPCILDNNLMNNSIKLFDNYYNTDNIILFFVNVEIHDNIFSIIKNLDLTIYKNYFYINNKLIFYDKDYKIVSTDNIQKYINLKTFNINKIINKLFYNLKNFNIINEIYSYKEFINYIYKSHNYRHYYYYENNKDIIDYNNNKYDNIDDIYIDYIKYKEDYNKHSNILPEYEEYKEIIIQAINIYDDIFNYYIKKLEPEIIKYYLILYCNNNYTTEYENNKDYDFKLMIEGLHKMCILIVKDTIGN